MVAIYIIWWFLVFYDFYFIVAVIIYLLMVGKLDKRFGFPLIVINTRPAIYLVLI